ncbi:ankyrin repeat-containing protein [Apiospora rasikravindrae]|uniref:Ankyrin repeat-containing protein n=1 Tax=Apiospora rasikravindrae TaxID=990691 RepID=A0ABR1S2U0_9PEZI
MRFINTTTFKFHELSDSDVRNLKNGYSILSHRWTWGSGEITYNDVLAMDTKVEAKGGFPKLAGACAVAKTLGYGLIWDDTCCINKTDSVELGEAINSMYRWYAESDVCIAFLEDVVSLELIENSEWFSRGWTLQELIAPKRVRFYDSNWEFLGDKASLADVLTRKTGIPADVLRNEKPPQACSVAQRMSWAAMRTTGRLEDRAYSLMGLFDINMPMIYGEREQAFGRLQQQIIAKSTDESIFAWDLDLLESGTREIRHLHTGMLASSPACFARCGDLVSLGSSRGFHINQFGLNIALPSTQISPPLGIYRSTLKVGKASATGKQFALFLLQFGESRYARVCSGQGESSVLTDIVPQDLIQFSIPAPISTEPLRIFPGLWLRQFSYNPKVCYSAILERDGTWQVDRMKLPGGEDRTVGIIQLVRHSVGPFWIKLGFGPSSQPMCCVVVPLSKQGNHAISDYMRTQATDLQRTPPGSVARKHHIIFDSDWTEPGGKAMLGVPPDSYESKTAAGSLDGGGFDFTYKAPNSEVSVSARLVPNMDWTSEGREIWAIDIVCDNSSLSPDHDNCWFC